MKPTILRKINIPGAELELFSDGDIFITSHTRYGSTTTNLPYAEMMDLYASITKQQAPLPASPAKPKKAVSKPALKVAAKIEKTPDGWKANVNVGGKEKSYYYRTRDQARGVSPEHKVKGLEGRIK